MKVCVARVPYLASVISPIATAKTLDLQGPCLTQAPEAVGGYHQVIQDFHTE